MIPPLLAAILLGRVLLSVSGNTVQKQLLNRGCPELALWSVTYGLMLVPAGILAASHGCSLNLVFTRDVMIAGVLDSLGNLAMVAALRTSDLSVFGPLNAFRPVLALLCGWMLLGEVPSSGGALGMVLTLGGAVLLLRDEHADTSPSRPRPAGDRWAALGYRISGLGLSSIAAVYLKRAALDSGAESTLAGWVVLGSASLMLAGMAMGGRGFLKALPRQFTGNRGLISINAVLFLLMQWLTLLVFQRTLLAYSFVFFQLGIILQMLVGWLFFNERAFGRARIAACVLMSLGSAAVAFRG